MLSFFVSLIVHNIDNYLNLLGSTYLSIYTISSEAVVVSFFSSLSSPRLFFRY